MKKDKDTKPSRLVATLKDDRARFITGAVFMGAGALFFLAFFSFLSNAGKADASSIANGTILSQTAQNQMGVLGSVVSEYCINRWLGVAAFLYVFFFLRLGYSIMRNKPLSGYVKLFVLYAVWSIWISLACAFFFVDGYQDTYIYLGGHHGYDLSQFLVRMIGWPGVLILLIVTFLILSVFAYNQTVARVSAAIDAVTGFWGKVRTKREEKAAGNEDADVAAAETVAADEDADVAADVNVDAADVAASEEIAPEEETEEPYVMPEVTDVDAGVILDENAAVDEAENHDADVDLDANADLDADEDIDVEEIIEEEPVGPIQTSDPTFVINAGTTEIVEEPYEMPKEDYDPTKDLEFYQFPTFDLLKQYDGGIAIDKEEQMELNEKIRQTLSDYGVEIQSISATVGPTITLFEIVLVSGTKINTIKRLSDEISMSIASRNGVRIIAPIPGKSAIGIEVPNKKPQMVSMRECIQSRAFQECKAALPVALGKTITNEVFTFDLAKAPHMLVAGATGQGKSVGLNAIITSLLYKKHPSQLKIVLVDPKMVEFSVYSNIDKHFLAKLPDAEDPIITDVSKVVQTLKSLCAEMEDRYALLREAGCRKLEEYNDKFIHRQLNPNKHIDAPIGSKEGTHHHYLPYIVAIIDEYGDLIMTAGKEVELPIARIAQKARAVGIHMIIATQRPSAKIVTGIIKANFPARIAFRVASATDSSIILDQSGAQNLVGRGDLFISLGDKFERVQCAFVDTPEVTRINGFIEKQQGYPTCYILPEPKPEQGEGAEDAGGGATVDLHQLDPLFAECAELVVASGQGSTSMIQRKFGIGYNRAGRVMDQMEAAGIVGPYQGSKARAVLVESVSELQNILEDLKNS